MLPLKTRKRLLLALVSGTRFAGLLVQKGDDLHEISGSGYKRQNVEFAVSDDATAVSTGEVKFGPARGAWDRATHIGVFESVSGGDALLSINIESPMALMIGDRWAFESGKIQISY